MVEKVIIIGSGPAGYTAAIYAYRDGLDPLLIKGFEAGGQLMLTSAVENFPGFSSILGPDLMEKLYQHAKGLGCRMIDGNVSKVDFSVYPYRLFVDQEQYETYSVVIATGASAKWLGLPNEKRLMGKGVSGCAVCDGFFFKNKDVIVVGGGDSAMEDASYLANMVKSVTVVHRRDSFKASKIMQEKVLNDKRIRVLWNSEVVDILGDTKVSGASVKDLKTGSISKIPVEGVFIAIGHKPNTDVFRGQIDIDKDGYINTNGFTKTSKEGVFCAGDVQDRVYKQAVIAAGWGCMAAMEARKFLAEKKII